MITSKQNEKIKFVKSLSQKKYRDEHGLYLAEGVKMVREALEKGKKVRSIVLTEKAERLIDLKGYSAEILIVSDDVFYSISGESTPQGALAVIEKDENVLNSPKKSCLFLDGVSDPANVGAIIRTAVACGITEIYMATPCADAYSPKAVRASMSGIYSAKIYEGQAEELLKVITLPIYVADMNGENVFSFEAKEQFCLVIGNEGHGVSALLKQKANRILSIPMQNGVESLNAGVSAGILMYLLKN